MGVIVKEALANGRLTERNNDPAFAKQRRLLSEVAAEAQTGLDGVALAAVIAQPWADVVLSGAAQTGHLTANLEAMDVQWRDTFDDHLNSLVEPAEVYWQTRSELAWN